MVFGAGGGTNSYQEIEETDLILLWGSNARETHPIFFHHLLKGLRNGARLHAIDPRRTSSVQWAELWAALDVGSDIALANAIAREIIAAGLENRDFIENATTGGRSSVGRGRCPFPHKRDGTSRRCSRRWSAAIFGRSTSSARTRSSPRPISTTLGTCSRASSFSWRRTCFSPRPRSWRTSSCPRARHGASPRAP